MSDAMDQMDQIDQLWRRIETRLPLVAFPTGPHLAAGASDQALERLEAALGGVLPEDFRASYRRHDGGFTMRLVTSMDILPLAGIIEAWQVLEELLRDEKWARTPPTISARRSCAPAGALAPSNLSGGAATGFPLPPIERAITPASIWRPLREV